MCGIAGVFNLNGEPVSPVLLRQMTSSMAHRGPDGEGFYTDSFIGLGHRRLAILDLSSAGHQPMTTEDGKFAITYNGEVYNFQELRAELETLDYRFRSRTDTEVVLNAYAEWGAECVKHFNGMFAFAIWDKTRQSLFVARDRYGVKPFYYVFARGSFLFASEQKALLCHPAVERSLDLAGLSEYFTFQNIFTDRTLLKGIKVLPSGCCAQLPLACSQNQLDITRYWDFSFDEPDRSTDEREYVEELDRLFRQAVNRQLVSDVELGSYLSGGMDSGSITAVAANHLPYIKTFTCGFDLHSASGLELGYDEREKAELMSYLFKTEHYEMVLKAGDMERVLPKLVWHVEEPRVGQSYPNFYAAQLAGKFVKVVLSGAGGDELFGGYPWRYYRAAVNNSSFDQYIDKYYEYWQRLIPNGAFRKIFSPIWKDVSRISTRDIFSDVFIHHKPSLKEPEDYVNASLYFEAKTFLHGLLTIEDKLSMAHGLETRVPFLDNDLVDFAMRTPVSQKLRNLHKNVLLNENDPGPKTTRYFQKTSDGKLLLRRVMEKYIPPEITKAEKRGFSAPDASWFKGESIDFVKKKLFNPRALIYEFMDRSAIKPLIEEHLQGKENRRLFIWSLLYMELWCGTFLANESR